MKQKLKFSLEYKIVIIYFVAGFLWILFSDKLLLEFAKSSMDSKTVTILQTYKGWFYIMVTAFLLFILIHSDTIRRNRIERELSAARQKAEEAEKLKNAFLANISHEIRTPLNGIVGFSELLNEEDLTQVELKDYTDHILRNSQQLLSTINSIIELSQLEVNAARLNPSYCNLRNILQSVYQTSLNLQKEMGKDKILIGVQNDVPDNLYEIYADESKLRHILMILVHNALKFSEKGNIQVNVRLQNKKELCFSVRDDGIGVPQTRFGKIFQSFNTVEQSDPDKLQGFGLGLSIAKGWVGLMKGKIWVESKYNAGSIFSFSIPLLKQQVSEKDFVNFKHKIPDLSGKTILIIEDVDYCYEYLYELLKHSNAMIRWAQNGDEGLRLYCEYNPDFIILDILLPILNGIEVAKEIRKKDNSTVLIGVSGFAHEQERQKCFEIGFNDYLTKPLKPADLIMSLKTYIT